MLVEVAVLVLALVAIGLVPVVMMATLFGIIQYLSDEQKLEEIQSARREGRPVDFSETRSQSGGDANDDLSPVTPPTDLETDVPEQSAPSPAATSTTCSNCGEENEGAFDRCWNCQATL